MPREVVLDLLSLLLMKPFVESQVQWNLDRTAYLAFIPYIEALDLVARYHVYLFLKARILFYNVTLASSAYPETPNERCTRTPSWKHRNMKKEIRSFEQEIDCKGHDVDASNPTR